MMKPTSQNSPSSSSLSPQPDQALPRASTLTPEILKKLKALTQLTHSLQTLPSDASPHQALQILAEHFPSLEFQYWSVPQKTTDPLQCFSPKNGAPSRALTFQLLSIEDSILAYLFKKPKTLTLNEVSEKVKQTSPTLSADTSSLMAVPTFLKKSIGGVLLIESPSPQIFTESDQLIFESIAQQLQAHLENQRAHQALQFDLKEKMTELKRIKNQTLKQKKTLTQKNKILKKWIEHEQQNNEDSFIGKSPAIQEILSMIEKIAPTLTTVLIQGESGTGKEVIAKRIHQKSARANAPFVTVNCAALQESLLESELFGHEKGAFTGAVQQKTGLCELANEGTLFLDEIGEMSLSIQTKLLRFLQEGEFYRVGGKTPIQVNVRILSATNRDLKEEVQKGRLREDLFFRLNTITLKIPALRNRREDIPLFCESFLKDPRLGGITHVKEIDPKVIEVFKNYSWPGNIRELQNTMERLKILSDGPKIKLDDVPYSIRMPQTQIQFSESTLGLSLAEMEKGHILRALEINRGNKTQAAKSLGITIKTLYNKLHRYGVITSDEAKYDQT